MKAKTRRDAHFVINERSCVFKQTVTWRITVSGSGLEATRDIDKRRIRIGWKALISAALFYGVDGS